ncbi:MAG: hypothetical protein U0838_00700 [Chloroflexota bacterium]
MSSPSDRPAPGPRGLLAELVAACREAQAAPGNPAADVRLQWAVSDAEVWLAGAPDLAGEARRSGWARLEEDGQRWVLAELAGACRESWSAATGQATSPRLVRAVSGGGGLAGGAAGGGPPPSGPPRPPAVAETGLPEPLAPLASGLRFGRARPRTLALYVAAAHPSLDPVADLGLEEADRGAVLALRAAIAASLAGALPAGPPPAARDGAAPDAPDLSDDEAEPDPAERPRLARLLRQPSVLDAEGGPGGRLGGLYGDPAAYLEGERASWPGAAPGPPRRPGPAAASSPRRPAGPSCSTRSTRWPRPTRPGAATPRRSASGPRAA